MHMHVPSIALIAIHIVKCRAYEKSGNGNKMETKNAPITGVVFSSGSH